MSLLKLILGTSNPDVRIVLQHISINPTVGATINYQIVSNTEGISDRVITIDGQQYAVWGADDTIIYHIICARHNLQYVPYIEPEFYEEAFVYKNDKGEIECKTIKKPNPKFSGTPSSSSHIQITYPSSSIDPATVSNTTDTSM